MKGVIFNLVEDIVTEANGPDAWDDLLEAAGLEGAYTALGSYGDDQLFALVDAAASASGLPPDDVMRHIGRKSLRLMAQRFPEFFTLHTSVRTFLLTLNGVIHPEVRKLYPGAQTPHFDFSEEPGGAILMDYHSARTMCPMAEGLTLGAGDHFGETLAITQTQCKKHGADFCTLRIAVE
ncbi:MAG: heme NO-binding domain-containing protein [Actinobacteria bacterium]|nr:heme NO-binding domain-containing protein [Actinomycetota bacterium]